VTAVQDKFATGKVTGKGGKPGDAIRLQ